MGTYSDQDRKKTLSSPGRQSLSFFRPWGRSCLAYLISRPSPNDAAMFYYIALSQLRCAFFCLCVCLCVLGLLIIVPYCKSLERVGYLGLGLFQLRLGGFVLQIVQSILLPKIHDPRFVLMHANIIRILNRSLIHSINRYLRLLYHDAVSVWRAR